MNRKAHGFGLLELMISLLIVGALLGAVVPMLYRGHEDARRADLMTEVGVIREQIHALFGMADNYAGLPTTLGALRSQLPTDYVSGSAIVTPWGDAITVGIDDQVVAGKPRFGNAAYAITVPVKPEVCTPLVLHAQGGFDYVIVAKQGGNRLLVANPTLKATPEQAMTACGTTGNRSVILVGA